MTKLVVLEIGDGDLAEGLPVTLRISEEGRQILRHSGKLPPAVEIFQHYDNWLRAYYNLPAIRNARITRIDIPDNQITNVSDEQRRQDYQDAAIDFPSQIQNWLKQPEFLNLRIKALRQVSPQETVRIIIATNNRKLWKLPWHLWEFFKEDCKNDPAISTLDYVMPPLTSLRSPVQILAIFGDSNGINIEPDRELLATLETRGAEITWLTQPTRAQLRTQLSGEAWDILFFAGHSYSEEHNGGVIKLNQSDRISLMELEQRFKEAVSQGLKLAIFNSCDGLGLAQNLAEVNLPHIIVMREPVPDQVAQRFLEHFLQEFSQGRVSLNQAVRYARIRLHEEETEYELPCASWLPIVYENPTTPELIWEQSSPIPPTPPITPTPLILLTPHPITVLIRRLLRWAKRSLALIIIFLVTILLIIYASLITHSVSVADGISEGEQILVKENSTPEKAEGVEAFKDNNFELAVEKIAASLKKQKNDPETLIYFNNAKIGDKPALKIAVSVPISTNLDVAQEMLRGVAQFQNEINQQPGGINGKLLQVAIANDENNPEIAKNIAETFVKDPKILAIVGPNSSNAAFEAALVYNKGGLVMITPTGYSSKTAYMGEYSFRMVPALRSLADKLSDYIIHTAKKTKLAICSSDLSPDTSSFSDLVEQSFINQRGYVVGVNCSFDDPRLNPDALISEIKKSGADSLLLAPYVDKMEQAIRIAQANKKARLSLFGSPSLNTNIILEQGGQAVNGLVLVAPWAAEQLPNNHPFLRQAIQLWGGKVNWRSAESYDATKVIATALKKAQTREELKNIIKNSSFEGVTGKIYFVRGDRQFVTGSASLVKVQPNPNTKSGYEFVVLPR